MKKTFVAAGAFALMATGAMAQDAETVTLTVTVGPYIEITQATDSSLTVADAFGGSAVSGNNNRNAGFGDKSAFTVAANVDFDIDLEWDTWQSPATGGYNHARDFGAAENCAIGGTITFDTDPAAGTANTATPPGGTSPWDVTTSAAFDPNAFSAGPDREFAIGIEASPEINTCDGGIAGPDDCTLDVLITVSEAS